MSPPRCRAAPAVEAPASTEEMVDELRIPTPEVQDEQPAEERLHRSGFRADYAKWASELP